MSWIYEYLINMKQRPKYLKISIIFKKNVDSVISINLVTSLYLKNLYSFKLLVLVTAAVQQRKIESNCIN